MAIYIIAQLIGFVGYLFYVSAPQFKSQKRIMQVGIVAYIILCLQWYMLEQYSLLTLNALGIIVSMCALKAQEDNSFKRQTWMLYPLGATAIVLSSHFEIIDLLALAAFVLTLRSQLSENISDFRLYALIAGSILVCSSLLALSVPAIIFNVAFTLVHAYHFNTLYQRRTQTAIA